MQWDTCAPESFIKAHGGKVTDVFGSPLIHCPTKVSGNILGVIASSGDNEAASLLHDAICKKMRSDHNAVASIFSPWIGTTFVGEQAIDISRDLDGEPLDKIWIQNLIAGKKDTKNHCLKGYSGITIQASPPYVHWSAALSIINIEEL